MQGPEDPRIDLAELKAHIVKKVGAERSRRYFYYLGRFLSQKVTKSEFDKSCHRLLGRENLPLHNMLIHSILRNASLAKSPPPTTGRHKSSVVGKEDGGPEGSGSLVRNRNRNDHVWSNGVLPPKVATRDRPSPLGPNGKVESLLHQPHCRDDKSGNRNMENGGPCRYADERGGALLDKGKVAAPVSRDEEAREEERGRLGTLSTSPVVAPLGIPFWAASVGGARRTVPVSTRANFIGCYDSGGLSDAEMLRKRMESIAVAQGLGGVSPECSSMLNSMLDVYLKKLIKSCVDLSGARSTNGNQSNSLQIQTSNQSSDTTQVSLLDFRAAMELNPSQLGENWPLLRERLLMRSFEEREEV
ncbi:Uncharacterized protein Rs2_13046 [Raphanus sativus]|uniref:Uncharacterized protein LOC108855889 n=1 Tax=Raphanus sativus TaxID=3726 RepID=A0A6J0NMI4_RAPSA|nr:uncharacterized protein LOC108855889 [Raphanus sativus]KAJ4899095.1 Uncharacterized protein Rs2_13046 [Raphanus sativus]